MFTCPIGFFNLAPIATPVDPYANNVVLLLKADQSGLTTNTTTTANFTVPAVNSTVTVSVVSSTWAAANRAIRIGNAAGNYIITAVPNGTQITVRNCGGTDNATASTVISSGATIALSIIDSSPTPKLLDAFGNTQLTTLAGVSCIYFDGSGDYLSIAASSDLALDGGNFTIETYINTADGIPQILNWTNNGVFEARNQQLGNFGGNFSWWAQNSTVTNLQNIAINTRTHIALCRDGNNFKYFVNGVLTVSFTSSVIYTGNSLRIGTYQISLFSLFYMDKLRITKFARYSANFNLATDTYLN